VPTDPDRCGKGADLPVMRDGMVLPPTGYAAVEAEAEAAEASPAAKL
jgi:hypothetical protein